MAPGGGALADGHRLLVLGTVGSTMDEAARLARAGEAGPLWVLAERQTGGRGRLGRPWASPPGNLHATLLLRDPCPPALAPLLGFAAGVALIDALRALAPAAAGALRLKWPNDVLAGGAKLPGDAKLPGGAKLAGLLLESSVLGDRLTVAVGFGVNLAAAPGGLPYPATSLAALGAPVAPAAALAALSRATVRALALFDAGRGFPAVRAAWRERALLGAPVLVGPERRPAVAVDLDEAGRLIVLLDGRREALIAADVFPVPDVVPSPEGARADDPFVAPPPPPTHDPSHQQAAAQGARAERSLHG